MALDTFDNLKESFVNELKASELTTGEQNEIVERAEAQILADINFTREGGEVVLITTFSDPDANGYYSLPDDYLETRSIALTAVLSGPLDYATPETIATAVGGSTTGTPRMYTIEGGKIKPAPLPDSEEEYKHTYWASFVPLSQSNQTNFVLQAYPTLYLRSCLFEAASFLQMDTAAKYKAMYDGTMRDTEVREWKRKAGGTPLIQRHNYGVT